MLVAVADSVSVRPERPAAEVMWVELRERLRAFVTRRVPDRMVADDLTQEILLRLYTHMGRLREQERLDAWAYQVARNVIADYWRDRATRREVPFDPALGDQLPSRPELEGDDQADQLRSEVASCLPPMVARLAEPYREAIRLTDLGSRTQADAAAGLGLSVPGMKARVQRARAQLRELLRACCRIELDRRGQITELVPHDDGCGADRSRGRCGCAADRARASPGRGARSGGREAIGHVDCIHRPCPRLLGGERIESDRRQSMTEMTTSETMTAEQRSFLRTGRGALTLALLLLVQFLDFLDVSIVNVACRRSSRSWASRSRACSGSSAATS